MVNLDHMMSKQETVLHFIWGKKATTLDTIKKTFLIICQVASRTAEQH